jgi:hypothetical protein
VEFQPVLDLKPFVSDSKVSNLFWDSCFTFYNFNKLFFTKSLDFSVSFFMIIGAGCRFQIQPLWCLSSCWLEHSIGSLLLLCSYIQRDVAQSWW